MAKTGGKGSAKKPKRPKGKGSFASPFEHRFACDCDGRGIEYEYEPHAFEWQPRPRRYVPDFLIRTASGKEIYIECKGHMDLDDRKKILATAEQHGIDIRLVFQKPGNKIRKGSKTSYALWCEKNGIPWAKDYVPEEWTKE